MSGLFAFPVEQEVNCATWFSESDSTTQTQRVRRRAYHDSSPSRNSMLGWAQNFQKNGSVEIQNRPESASKTSENEWRASDIFDWHPRTSLRTTENPLGLPGSFIQWALWNRPYWFPYGLCNVEELLERDYEARNEPATWCLRNIKSDRSLLKSCNLFQWDFVLHECQSQQAQRKDLGI